MKQRRNEALSVSQLTVWAREHRNTHYSSLKHQSNVNHRIHEYISIHPGNI